MELSGIIGFVITLCYLVLLARIILGFVVQYMQMQGNNPPDALFRIYEVVFAITEPVLAPIRRVLPQLGMLDLSPLVVMIILVVIQRVLQSLLG
jgi:YggT family protein